MDRRVVVFLALLLLVGGGVAYLVLNGDVEGAGPASAPAPVAEAPRDAPPADPGAERADASSDTVAAVGARTITGRVVDATGAPLPGSRIIIDRTTVRADNEGRFLRVPLPNSRGFDRFMIAGGEWHAPVVYSLDDKARPPLRKIALRPGENLLGDVVLVVSGAVEGVVVDDRGTPVAGASVTLASLGRGKPADASSVRTDARGQYKLSSVAPGPTELRAWLDGREARSGAVDVKPRAVATAPQMILLRSAADRALRGKVVSADNGEPLGGVRVRVPLQQGKELVAYSDADGKFTITDLPDTTTPVPLEASGHGFGHASFGPFHPQDTSVVLALQGGALVSLRLTDASSGAPIEEFGAWSCAADARGANDEKPPIEKHPGGIATIRASAPRRTRVVVDAPGYLMVETYIDTTKPTAELRVPRGIPLKVRVTRRNKPVVGADVSVVFAKAPKSFNSRGVGAGLLGALVSDVNAASGGSQVFQIGPDGADLGSVTPEVRARSVDRERRTGADGTVDFLALPEDDLLAIVRDPKGVEARSPIFSLRSGTPGDVTVLYQDPGSFAGTIAGFVPGETMSIVLRRTDGEEEKKLWNANADAEGKFIFESLRPGPYRGTVQILEDGTGPDFASPVALDVTVAEARTANATFDLTKDVRATVRVHLSWIGSTPGPLRARWQRIEPAPPRAGREFPVDGSGCAELKRVPPGKIQIDIYSEGQILLARLDPVEAGPGQAVDVSRAFEFGSVHVHAGPRAGKERVPIQVSLPLPSIGGTAMTNEEGELLIVSPKGPLTASAMVDGKPRMATANVVPGVDQTIELKQQQ